MKSQPELESTRVDKWLWAARFFKHRKLATEAVSGGHVHLNGNRIKPARAIHVGDELTISKGNISFEVTVEAISDKRGSATIAATLYHESDESRAKREAYAEQMKLQAASAPSPAKRPDKRSRRRIIQFKQ
ncbi:MAG: S4 domain-containing protein [Gammaproteobacteria bacterium]|nr:S4 domain-containing protein [Gammaproteobacteria bacterium]MCW8887707.1 S4 domain-containing protein [Gammaproteobacteria bacterium]